jgi:hypothetical protein
MRSVADDLRDDLRQSLQDLSLDERMELAFRLGDEGVAAFQEANGLDREAAVRLLQRRRQAGRTPSRCLSELIG